MKLKNNRSHTVDFDIHHLPKKIHRICHFYENKFLTRFDDFIPIPDEFLNKLFKEIRKKI